MSPKDKIHCWCRGHGGPEIVEPCIRELVDCLNRHGVETTCSCCGHGVSLGSVHISAENIKKDPNGGYELRLDKKPIVCPHNQDQLRWVEGQYGERCGSGKPWHAFVRVLLQGLKEVVELEVLHDELFRGTKFDRNR